jgi:hypothetical protein
MKKWTTDEVIEVLNTNEYYKKFEEEYQGKFSCIYNVAGVCITIFNEVGGHKSVYFTGITSQSPDIESAQSFAYVCCSYLNRVK